MTLHSGRSVSVIIGGEAFSERVEEVSLELRRSMATFSPLAGDYVQRAPGFLSARVSLSGMPWDDAHENINDAWSIFNSESSSVWSIIPTGDTAGNVAICGEALGESSSAVAGDDIVRIPIGVFSTGEVDVGKILRGSGNTVSPGPTIDFGTTMDSGAAYVFFYDGTGSISVTFEHSDNGTDWSTLTTINLSSPGASMVEVSGPIQRYLRVQWSSSGSPSWLATFCGR
jgi:hypothetical protein